jgi:hypothetical protein
VNDIIKRLLEPDIFPVFVTFMVPIVAIPFLAIFMIVKKVIAHRERMAMIERGIHPDYPPEDVQENSNPPQIH